MTKPLTPESALRRMSERGVYLYTKCICVCKRNIVDLWPQPYTLCFPAFIANARHDRNRRNPCLSKPGYKNSCLHTMRWCPVQTQVLEHEQARCGHWILPGHRKLALTQVSFLEVLFNTLSKFPRRGFVLFSSYLFVWKPVSGLQCCIYAYEVCLSLCLRGAAKALVVSCPRDFQPSGGREWLAESLPRKWCKAQHCRKNACGWILSD